MKLSILLCVPFLAVTMAASLESINAEITRRDCCAATFGTRSACAEANALFDSQNDIEKRSKVGFCEYVADQCQFICVGPDCSGCAAPAPGDRVGAGLPCVCSA
ncbi:hypothetical protein EAF04_002808 [Stromatinia cepivora]|nr:hypothetical protein EAF04_002808 [Stromatinia cepivora]